MLHIRPDLFAPHSKLSVGFKKNHSSYTVLLWVWHHILVQIPPKTVKIFTVPFLY